jgi:hypothetical protein
MPRKFDGPVDLELLREYILPALRVIVDVNRTPRCPVYDGRPHPGRAKAVELAADWLEDLLAREAEYRTLQLQVKYGRRRLGLPVTPDAADKWLEEQENEYDAANAAALGVTDPGYRCPECGIEIEAGSKIAAGIRGIIHAECPDFSNEPGGQQYDY